MTCEYCRRIYHSAPETCIGCGAPFRGERLSREELQRRLNLKMDLNAALLGAPHAYKATVYKVGW